MLQGAEAPREGWLQGGTWGGRFFRLRGRHMELLAATMWLPVRWKQWWRADLLTGVWETLLCVAGHSWHRPYLSGAPLLWRHLFPVVPVDKRYPLLPRSVTDPPHFHPPFCHSSTPPHLLSYPTIASESLLPLWFDGHFFVICLKVYLMSEYLKSEFPKSKDTIVVRYHLLIKVNN